MLNKFLLFFFLKLTSSIYLDVIFSQRYPAMYTVIGIGTPVFEKKIAIDIQRVSNFIWKENYRIHLHSFSLLETEENASDNFILGSDWDEINVPHLKFIYSRDWKLLTEGQKHFIGALSFSKSDNSTLSQLKSKGLISTEAFGFTGTKLFLGDDSFIANRNTIYSCDMIDNSTLWGCYLNKIEINNEVSFKKKIECFFDTNINGIILPYIYYVNLFKRYFQDFTKDGMCTVETSMEDLKNITRIYCEKEVFESVKDIWIYFDDFKFPLDNAIIFTNSTRTKNMFLEFGFSDEKDEICSLGFMVLKKFGVFFNKENKKIYFTLDNQEIKRINLKKEINIRIIKILYGNVIIMLLITFINLIFAKINLFI